MYFSIISAMKNATNIVLLTEVFFRTLIDARTITIYLIVSIECYSAL